MLKNRTNKKEKNDNPVTINLNDDYMSQLLKVADAYNISVAACGRMLLQKVLISEYAKMQTINKDIKPAVFKLM